MHLFLYKTGVRITFYGGIFLSSR